MTKEYIERESVLKCVAEDGYDCEYDLGYWSHNAEFQELIKEIPVADVEPVRHAYWVKRMEHGVGRGYEVHTPIWSCSDCGRDYDPASCSIIKYCYNCGAKMDGGQDDG